MSPLFASQFLLIAAGSTAAVWTVFLALTALHIYANVRAVRVLEVRTLNAARLEGLLAHYAVTARSQPPLPDLHVHVSHTAVRHAEHASWRLHSEQRRNGGLVSRPPHRKRNVGTNTIARLCSATDTSSWARRRALH